MCGWCCCNIHCVRFAVQANPPCCRFPAGIKGCYNTTLHQVTTYFCARCELCSQLTVRCIQVRWDFKCLHTLYEDLHIPAYTSKKPSTYFWEQKKSFKQNRERKINTFIPSTFFHTSYCFQYN